MSGDPPASGIEPGFWIVVRTSGRRTEDVCRVFDTLESHKASIEGIVMVDSSESTMISNADLLTRFPWISEMEFNLHECEGNIGPAAATNKGMEIIAKTSPESWVIVMDDDQPLAAGYLLTLRRSIGELSSLDPDLAAVGRIGHRVDRRWARISRPSRREIRGIIPVDYLPTNFAPAFHLPSVLAVGGMRESLFIGQTEVALGLDLRKHSFTLYAIGSLWQPSDASSNWRGVTFEVVRSPWRRYYSVRNWVFLSREHLGTRQAILASVRAVAGALLHPPRARRLYMTMQAVRDGWTGRLGKTVPPVGRESSIT